MRRWRRRSALQRRCGLSCWSWRAAHAGLSRRCCCEDFHRSEPTLTLVWWSARCSPASGAFASLADPLNAQDFQDLS
ncbi:hypothetical protein SPHINGOT1_230055 [Sphingomonas sp. T1]|nr:hypothetical protein SPHINGOT1_230055 [Sphingomonas sp. T1]